MYPAFSSWGDWDFEPTAAHLISSACAVRGFAEMIYLAGGSLGWSPFVRDPWLVSVALPRRDVQKFPLIGSHEDETNTTPGCDQSVPFDGELQLQQQCRSLFGILEDMDSWSNLVRLFPEYSQGIVGSSNEMIFTKYRTRRPVVMIVAVISQCWCKKRFSHRNRHMHANWS